MRLDFDMALKVFISWLRLKQILLILLLPLAACSTLKTTYVAPPSKIDLEKVLALPESIPEQLLSEFDDDLLALTQNMKKFVASNVPEGASREARLDRLFSAISSNPDHKITYDSMATLTAADTFEKRRGNCLSFSAMFIALAREAGLQASFQQVDVPPMWDALSDEVLIQYRHVNVKVKLRDNSDGVIDFRVDRYSETFPRKILSDNEGLALYYSNIGMQYVVEGDYDRAFVASMRALEADADTAFIWSNMGIVQRRLGNLALAEISYRQALQLDPYHWSALSNLAYVYDEYGNTERADELRHLSNNYKLRDPYYRYALAQYSYRKGDYQEAIDLLNISIARRRFEHRFYYLRALSFWGQGNKKSAIQNVKKAISVSRSRSIRSQETQIIQARYENSLESWEKQFYK